MLVLALAARQPIAVIVAVAFWGFTLGGAPTMLQAACARAAGPAIDVAQPMLVIVLERRDVARALGGGVALAMAGLGSLAWISLALFAVALLIASAARRNGFPVTSHTRSDAPADGRQENTAARG